MSSHVQAIIVPKEYYTEKQAHYWVKKNGFKPIKRVHSSSSFWRFRIKEPNEQVYNYRLVKFGSYIKAVVGFEK